MFTEEGLSIAERVNRTIRNLSKTPVFEKGKTSRIGELTSVIKQYNNTIHSSIKMTPNQASRKPNEKLVFNNLKYNRENQKPKFKLEQLVRTADIKRFFNKGDSMNSVECSEKV